MSGRQVDARRVGAGAPDPAALAGVLADLTQEPPQNMPRRIAMAAAQVVAGCDHASLAASRGPGRPLATLAATTEVAEKVDGLQRRSGQGPTVAALLGPRPVHLSDLVRERRFRPFAEAAVRLTPVRSALAVRLPPETVDGHPPGVLTLYADRAGAFSPADEDLGRMLAAHAGLSVTAARQRQRIANLDQALETNREIGMAIGVLMTARRLTRDQAFTALRETSQRLNVKLRDVAAHVVRTGEVPER